MTDYQSLGGVKKALYRSVIVPVGDTITLEATEDPGMSRVSPHGFAGIEFLDGAGDGANVVAATGGTATIEVRTTVNPSAWESFANNEIDCTAPTTPNWDGTILAVRAVPSGITGATHYRLRVQLLDS